MTDDMTDEEYLLYLNGFAGDYNHEEPYEEPYVRLPCEQGML